jgi:uncharacterized protein YndB with AHSA1/START domain
MTHTILAERSLTFTRILKAPRNLVWRAWTDPKQLQQWWGPTGFTAPVVEGDIKVGGTLHITMRGPKGSPYDIDLPMVKRYLEIVPNEKLVFENEPLGPDGVRVMQALTTIIFTDHPEGTLMEIQTTAKALVEQAIPMLNGMEQGWSSSLEKLDRFVEA